MIFRDDDISHNTKLDDLVRVHGMFQRAEVTHTVALIMQNLQLAPDLVRYLRTEPWFDLQLHCWQHVDLTTEPNLDDHLDKALELYEQLFGDAPTVLYPPWNRSDVNLIYTAGRFGLKVRPNKISLAQYIKVRGDVREDTVNFHYWAPHEQILVEPALAIYNQKRSTI